MTVPKPKRTLLSMLRVQEDFHRELRRILLRAASSIDADLKTLAGAENIGAVIRREQLAAVKKSIHTKLAAIYRETGYIVNASRQEAAAASIQALQAYEKMLLGNVIGSQMAGYYLDSAAATSRAGIEAAVQRMLGTSYYPLSEQVYRTQMLSQGMVDRYVETALTKGLNWKELANGVRDMIRPDVRGGVSYAAERLGRTEINNAFHAMAAQRGRENPWVVGMHWWTSSSHGGEDLCNIYAYTQHYDGWPQGVFPTNAVPEKPHPFCMCFITPEVPSEEAFLKLALSDARGDEITQEYLREQHAKWAGTNDYAGLRTKDGGVPATFTQAVSKAARLTGVPDSSVTLPKGPVQR